MTGRSGSAPTADCDVLIVGAGAAGVAAGRRLMAVRPDLSFRILEARGRIGGRARTDVVEGLPLDLGCGWFHGAKDNAWAALAAELGFPISRAKAAWDGKSRDLGLSPAETASAEAALASFFERADDRGGHDPDLPLAGLLEPGNRWNTLLDVIGTYINGVELAEASARDFARYDPGRGPDTRPEGGYGRLVEAYAEPLPISLRHAVQRIDHSGRLIAIECNGAILTTTAVIITVPTNVLAREQLVITPTLPDKLDAAASLPLGLDNKLFLFLPRAEQFQPETYLMGSAERAETASYHIRPFGRPIVECYLGGRWARELEKAGTAAATAFAVEELSRRFGPEALRGARCLAGSAWGAETFIGGAYSYARPGRWDQRAVLAAPVDQRLFFAGEACPPHRFSTAHGAFESGVAAADAAVAALS